MENNTTRSLTFPSRFSHLPQSHADAQVEIAELAATIARGTALLTGVYMRLCDIIRERGLTDQEVRESLGTFFPPSRISEILRVAHAPERTYTRYSCGMVGFKAVLREVRGYVITPTAELRRRKLTRAAERVVILLEGPGVINVRGRVVRVE